MSNLTINTEYDQEDVEFKVTNGGQGKIRFPEAAWHNVLNAAELYQVYDWIAENFERPKEPTLFETQWPQVKIGDEFGFGPEHRFFHYVKVSETSYTYRNSEVRKETSNLTEGNHARGISWRTPEPPTPLEQFQALNKGDKFMVKFKYVSSSQAPRVKISDTEWVNLLTGGIHTTELLDAADRIEPVV